MNYTTEALGQVIKELREGLPTKTSQEELGKKASYGQGAGVSISRIEAGLTSPTQSKLAGIAGGLGVTVHRLQELASERTQELADSASSTPSVPEKPQTVKERALTVEARTRHRLEKVDRLTAAYDAAHRKARDEFFLPFIKWAEAIQGVQVPSTQASFDPGKPLVGQDLYKTTAIADVSTRSQEIVKAITTGLTGIGAGAATGAAAAYATYSSVELLGKASTGVPISSLSGVARNNATLAVVGGGTLASGGGGMVAGTNVLSALVAFPLVIGGIAAGAFLINRRNKAEEAKLAAQLDAAEAKLEQMKPGFDLLSVQLPKATGTLEYIATHASHAFQRWVREFPEPPLQWELFTDNQKRRFKDFVAIAACETAIDGIETAQFMTSEGSDLIAFAETSAATLKYADTKVRTLV